ncbi:MAG: ATP-binding protein [Turneriella sp.]
MVLLLLFLAACGRSTTVSPVSEGKVDLFHIPFTEGPILELNGTWEYYPNRLIEPSLIAKHLAERKFAPVPQSFNLYADAALRLPAAACATYRLELMLPPQIANYTLRIPQLQTASRIYVNGHLEAESGRVAENPAEVVPATRMRYLQLPLAGRTELIIHVANGMFNKGGIAQPVSIASAAAMERFRLEALVSDVVESVSLITFALYHALLFFLRHPERSSVFYGLFCLMVGISRLFSGETVIADIFPSLPWAERVRVEYVINFFGAAFFTLYIRNFFPDFRRSRQIAFMVILPVVFGVLALVLPFSWMRGLREPFQIIMAVFLPMGMYLLGRLAWRNVYGARLLVLGVTLLGGAFLNDALRRAEWHSGPLLFSYATLGFTFMQAILISGKSLRLFHENAELSLRLLRSDKLRDEFLEHTSHELRTPVQAMVQTIENVRRGLSGAVSEQVQRTLAVVEESGQRLMYLIDDLRDFIRLKHSDLRLNLQTVSLRKVIDPVLKLGLGLTENRQFALIDEIPEGLEDVQVDPVRLQQILLNLLNTAIRYSHSHAITVKLGTIDRQLAISVIYNGADPDPRYTETLETESEDVGPLVTQKLAELMGGKYIYQKFAESQHALSITIPYAHIDALEGIIARSRHRTEHRKTEAVQGSPLLKGADSTMAGSDRVMVVGDHAGQNRLLQEQLASLGKVVAIAKNGAEAMLQLQHSQDISLVICDLLLSDVSGIELTMNIRTQYDIGLLPVILIIDSNQAGVAASAFSAGVNDLIRRPFEKAEVVARVRNLLLQREASLARENYRALNRELEIARSIQESIIPTSQPRSGNCKIEAVCMPARSIGGDFYDFVEDENTVGILIADVAGHGIPAALYAAMLKIAFHNLRDKARFPEKLLRELNDVMVDRGERTFISCAYTLVDFKNKRLLHANAGHLPLLVQEPGKKTVKRIQPPGGVLGIRKAAAITVEMQHLQPETRLVLFTDGVIEMTNKRGQFFDEERLVQVLEELRDAPLAAVKERLLASLREFAEGEQFLDDVTFVLLDV